MITPGDNHPLQAHVALKLIIAVKHRGTVSEGSSQPAASAPVGYFTMASRQYPSILRLSPQR